MKANFMSIKITTFILISLYLGKSIAWKRKPEENEVFKFTYVKGAFHVRSSLESSTASLEMSIVGCTNIHTLTSSLTNLVTATLNRRSITDNKRSHDLGPCVIIYLKKDCQKDSQFLPFQPGIELTPSFYKNSVKSFHLCSWKPPFPFLFPTTDTKTPLQQIQKTQTSNLLTYTFFEDTGCRNKLLQYDFWDLKECQNLPEFADKKISSVCSIRECLNLYDQKDCRGSHTKLVSDITVNRDLGIIQWNDKARSLKSCGMFLHARIVIFKFISRKEDMIRQIKPKKIEKSQIFVNNKKVGNSLRIFKGMEEFKENFTFENVKGLYNFYSLTVETDKVQVEGYYDRNEILTIERLKNELKNAYQFHSPHDVLSRNPWEAVEWKTFQVEREFSLPPCTKYNITSVLSFTNDLKIGFELGLEIFGEFWNKNMTVEDIKRNLPKGLTYLKDLDKFKILGKVNGNIIANLGIDLDAVLGKVEPYTCQDEERTIMGPSTLTPSTSTTSKPETGNDRESDDYDHVTSFPELRPRFEMDDKVEEDALDRNDNESVTNDKDEALLPKMTKSSLMSEPNASNLESDEEESFFYKYRIWFIIGLVINLIVIIAMIIMCWLRLRRKREGKRPEYNLVIGNYVLTFQLI